MVLLCNLELHQKSLIEVLEQRPNQLFSLKQINTFTLTRKRSGIPIFLNNHYSFFSTDNASSSISLISSGRFSVNTLPSTTVVRVATNIGLKVIYTVVTYCSLKVEEVTPGSAFCSDNIYKVVPRSDLSQRFR